MQDFEEFLLEIQKVMHPNNISNIPATTKNEISVDNFSFSYSFRLNFNGKNNINNENNDNNNNNDLSNSFCNGNRNFRNAFISENRRNSEVNVNFQS